MLSQIIYFLKTSQGYLSGEELSRQLKISRAGIWKYIEELRREGYDIVAVPHLGYKLVSLPDKIIPREIRFGLGTRFLGNKIFCYDVVDSTMNAAFQLAFEGAVEGALICSESQAKGKGRLGRQWKSPARKGIYASIILRPEFHPSDVARITLLSAVAVCEAVRKFSGIQAVIKWPNDLLVGNKKLAGILMELSAEMDSVRFVIVGIGINVNTPLSLLPLNATSLKNETGQKYSRVGLLQEVLRCLESWYGILKKHGFAPVAKKWKEFSSMIGRDICIEDAGKKIKGKAVDIDEYGRLMIRTDSGMMIKKMSGDVVKIFEEVNVR